MRSAIIAAAFAIGALAVPHQKRDMVTNTEYEVVYVTDIQTVTAGGDKAIETPEQKHNGHRHGGFHGWGHPNGYTTEAAPPPAPTTTTIQTRNPAPSPAPSPSPSPSAGGTPPSAPGGSGYSDIAVYHHNLHRSNHSAPDVAWDSALESTAAKIAATCVYAHNT